MNVQHTVTKRFPHIPFGHRLHRHAGHCQHLHGHDWGIELTFTCAQRDELGFVVEFGGPLMRELRDVWNLYDHALLLAADDPLLPVLNALEHAGGETPSAAELDLRRAVAKVYPVQDATTEGLAAYFLRVFSDHVQASSEPARRGLRLLSVTLSEGTTASATATAL